MKEKQQVLHLHGGMPAISHKNYLNMISSWSYNPWNISIRWSKRYSKFLNENFEIIRPDMPNSDYASYEAWDIWFQKALPYLKNNLTLVGHSLGGGFLMKWLAQNKLPITVKQLHLVAPTFDYTTEDYILGDFSLKEFPGKFFDNNISEVHIYHSKDDPEVPISESEKYHSLLLESHFHIFEDRGHFLGEEFPELFENIKKSQT